jgi:hypothetical protein
MITGIVSEEDYLKAHRLHRRPVADTVNWVMGLGTVLGLVLAILGVKPWGITQRSVIKAKKNCCHSRAGGNPASFKPLAPACAEATTVLHVTR